MTLFVAELADFRKLLRAKVAPHPHPHLTLTLTLTPTLTTESQPRGVEVFVPSTGAMPAPKC